MLDWLLFDVTLLSNPEVIARLVLQAALFFLSAFFSMSETALFSLSSLDLQRLRDERHQRSDTIHQLLDYPRSLIVSILCGNELVNVAATVNLAGVLLILYGNPEQAGWINILIMFPLLLVFGEITPKTLAVTNTYKVASNVVAAPIGLWVRLVGPLRRIVMSMANYLTTLVIGVPNQHTNLLGTDEIKTLLAEVTDHGDLGATERIIIDNLLDSKDAEVITIMIPRARMIFLDIEKPLPELIESIRLHKRSRFPAYRGHPDNIVGIIRTDDIASLIHSDIDLTDVDIESILRPVVAVPTTKAIHEMLELFRRDNTTSALVFNEWGSVDGFVTLRQVLRFFIGVLNSHSTDDHSFEEIGVGRFIVSGQMHIEHVNALLNCDLTPPRMTTIGGMVFQKLDRLPRAGDTVTLSGVFTRVISMSRHRIDRVEISMQTDVPGDSNTDAVPLRDEVPLPITSSDTELHS